MSESGGDSARGSMLKLVAVDRGVHLALRRGRRTCLR